MSILTGFQVVPVQISALPASWHPQVICFACGKHVSSQRVEWVTRDPLAGMSVPICLFPILSNLQFDRLASKLEFGGQVTLMARSVSIKLIGWLC